MQDREKSGDGNLMINALVLLSLTSRLDDQMESVILNLQMEDDDDDQESTETTKERPTPPALFLPFGDKPTFEQLLNWVLYGTEPDNVVALQNCVEVGRYYGIRLPRHEDLQIIQEKINRTQDVPLIEQAEEDMGETLVPQMDEEQTVPDAVSEVGAQFYCDRKLVVIGEKIYRKKWPNRNKTGWYYYCLSPGCHGSVLVSQDSIRAVSLHNNSICRRTKTVDVDLLIWQQIDTEMQRIVSVNPDLCSFDLLTRFMRVNETLSSTLLTAPVAAVLQYISAMKKQDKLQLDEILTGIAEVQEGSVIYQQVVPQRLIVYSHPQIRELSDVKWLLIDGTFRRCPKQFYQCVTFLSRESRTGVFFPLCHCLLPDKCLETYNLLFSIIDGLFPFPNLEFVTVDFEKALINAAQTWISSKKRPVRILGCKFHFSKCITKHFRKSRRKKMTDMEREFISLFYSLPFLQESDIKRLFNALSTVDHPHAAFIAYFRRTWMKKDIFPLWNVSHQDNDGLNTMYTNNGIESFHKLMSRQLNPHPQVQVFLRWAEDVCEERLKMIRFQATRDWEQSSDHRIQRIEVLARWADLLQYYPTRQEYRVLSFGFTCPHCARFNNLVGRRRCHLKCENSQCIYYSRNIECDTVFSQVQDSLLASLSMATRFQIPRDQLHTVLENLLFWMWTLYSDDIPEDERSYVLQVCHFLDDHCRQMS